MVLTVNEFANRIGVEYVIASSVLKYLVITGDVQTVGSRKTATGKGKPSILYEVPDTVSLNLVSKVMAKAA